MDFEAPPPFVGALEEPPDSECDARLTVDDEDDSIRELEIPSDLPCTSSTVSSPAPSLCSVKQKSPHSNVECHTEVSDDQNPDHCTNGIADDEEDIPTASDFLADDKEEDRLADDEEEERSAGVNIEGEDDFDDDFGDFAGIDTDIPHPEPAGSSSELPPKENSAEGCNEPDQYGLVRQPNAVGRGSLPPLSTSTVLEPTPFTANGTTYNVKAPRNAPAAELRSRPMKDILMRYCGLFAYAAYRSSALLDVDFLSANSGGGCSSTISTLQKELDQLGLTSTEPPTLRKPASQPTMLDMLMASATNTSKRNSRQPSELSLDARALHDQLPDLDFLRANMIMFPLGGNRSNES
ncbi:hypothetical protein OSTOST_19700 [Ostertagia ostertagi]